MGKRGVLGCVFCVLLREPAFNLGAPLVGELLLRGVRRAHRGGHREHDGRRLRAPPVVDGLVARARDAVDVVRAVRALEDSNVRDGKKWGATYGRNGWVGGKQRP